MLPNLERKRTKVKIGSVRATLMEGRVMEMTTGNLLDIRTDHNCVTDLGLLFYLLYGYYRE